MVSVATDETDGYLRFIRSLNIYGYKHEVKSLSFIMTDIKISPKKCRLMDLAKHGKVVI